MRLVILIKPFGSDSKTFQNVSSTRQLSIDCMNEICVFDEVFRSRCYRTDLIRKMYVLLMGGERKE